jgi:hypothetical protein
LAFQLRPVVNIKFTNEQFCSLDIGNCREGQGAEFLSPLGSVRQIECTHAGCGIERLTMAKDMKPRSKHAAKD